MFALLGAYGAQRKSAGGAAERESVAYARQKQPPHTRETTQRDHLAGTAYARLPRSLVRLRSRWVVIKC